MRIPLFDIDWTLLKGDNTAHLDAFAHAFLAVYGIQGSINEIEYEGMTDQQILVEVLKLHGISRDQMLAKLPAVRTAMADYFTAHKSEGEYQPLPGVKAVLGQLRHQRIPCGLLTGNTETIAWQKLEAAGIRHFFTFGAFGDATDRRVELIVIARQRCRVAHQNLNELELVIIGDTPRDIQCAKEGDIRSVAIASGKYRRAQLARSNPALLLSSLKETEKLLNFLLM